MIPGSSRNWRRTSSTTWPPARHGLDREGREQVDHQPADQEPDQDRRFGDAEDQALPPGSSASSISNALKRTSAASAAQSDRVALGHRLGRVADRVERIGDVADILGQVGHLGDPARVVGDRGEGVEGDDQAAERELRGNGDGDPVDAASSLAPRIASAISSAGAAVD